MPTRANWNKYKQEFGLDIWGAQEIRGSVDNWTTHQFYPGGNGADLMFLRVHTSVANASGQLCAIEAMAANAAAGAAGVNIGTLQTFLFNTIGKGSSTITLMRGGEIKCEWLATDVVTDARALQIEFMGLAAPTNPVYGIYFEKESASGAMAAKFYEIRMKAGPCVISGNGAPSLTAPKNSLYVNADASSATTRLYINTDGAATWAYFTASA